MSISFEISDFVPQLEKQQKRASVNASIDSVATMKTLNSFTQEMEKMNMKDEMWSDMVDMRRR